MCRPEPLKEIRVDPRLLPKTPTAYCPVGTPLTVESRRKMEMHGTPWSTTFECSLLKRETKEGKTNI